MKRCPNCSQFFTDDNMFCLNDGTSLLYVSETGQAPPVFPVSGDQPTVFVPKPHQTPAVFTPPATAVVQGGSAMKWILPVLGFLLGIICVLGFLVFYMKFSASNANNTSTTAVNSAAQTNQESSTPPPNTKPAERKDPTPAPVKSATPPPPTNAPVVSRMSFRRGEITHNETGRIGGERVFLLRCRRGQTLSASVSSDNGCVRFDNNSSSLDYITTAGDNRLNLINTCETTAFNISVTIR